MANAMVLSLLLRTSACGMSRPSDKDTPKAARQLDMGPDATPMEDSLVHPPSPQEGLSHEDEQQEQEQLLEEAAAEQPMRKKMGDEPPSRQTSPEVQFDGDEQIQDGEEEEVQHPEDLQDDILGQNSGIESSCC